MYLMSGNDRHTRFWANGFGLAANNYKIIIAGDLLSNHGIHALSCEIENEIVENEISLLLIEVSSPIYDPFVIMELKRKYGLMVVLLAIDDEFKFDWISSTYATIADLVLTTDHVSVDRYRQSGINAHFFLHPIYIPPKETKQRQDDTKHGVSFVGRVDEGKPSRMAFVRFLARNDIDVLCLSSSGKDDPSFLSREDMYSVFRTSAINLSFSGITTYVRANNVLNDRSRGMKGRPFEIAAAGGFCLSEYSISLANCFEDGVDIVFFHSKEGLLEKIRYYLMNRDEAEKIAAAGSKKITKQFSCEAVATRLRELIEESQAYTGVDLYGEPHRLQVSVWFAHSFIEFTLPSTIALLFKGRLRSFLNDSLDLARFIKRLTASIGVLLTLQVILIVLYRLGRTMLALVKSQRFVARIPTRWNRS